MNWKQLIKEVKFRADKSSGSGGQHVNKVATKVTLSFSPAESQAFSGDEKELILKRLEKKLSREGFLIVREQSHRSQIRNRKYALQKLELILRQAVRPPQPARKKIKKKINTAARRKAKDQHAEKKMNRRKVNRYDSGL